MRMFFAVTLEEGIKTALLAGQGALDSWCDRAKFTEKNNLHLTIKFIGEVAQRDIPSLEEAAMAAAIRTRPFPLTLQEVGAFFRGREAVVWAGVAKEPGLMALYRHLQFALEQQGFPKDRAKYTPHITLARQARLKITKPYRDEMENKNQWCIAAGAGRNWAKKEFPKANAATAEG